MIANIRQQIQCFPHVISITIRLFGGNIVIASSFAGIRFVQQSNYIVHVKHAIHILFLHCNVVSTSYTKYSSFFGSRQTRAITKFDDNKIHR